MPTNECIEALESDLAQYVLDRKVDESMKRYFRTRVYPIASVLGAVLVFFGIQLNSLYKDYAALEERALKAEGKITTAEGKIDTVKGGVASLDSDWKTVRENIDRQILVADTKFKAQEGFLQNAYDRQTRATDRAVTIAAEIAQALSRAEDAATVAADKSTLASADATRAKDSADTAASSKLVIDDARTSAAQYQEEVRKQQKILGTTITDFAILAAKIPSTVTLHDPRDFEHPMVLELVPKKVQSTGFTIEVKRNGKRDEPLDIQPSMFGRWQDLPATDGMYRYMVDFVYDQRGVRNFVVMRFGGSSKLFEAPAAMAARR